MMAKNDKTKKLNETSAADIDRFEEIIGEIARLVDDAFTIVRMSGNRTEEERARSYWRGHIQGALGENYSEYAGGSMVSMEDTLNTLREDNPSEDEEEGDEEGPGAENESKVEEKKTEDPVDEQTKRIVKDVFEAQ
jgi:hypothetical protein